MANPVSAEELISKALNVGERVLRSYCGSQVVHEKESARDYPANVDIAIDANISRFFVDNTPEIPVVGEELSPNR